MKSRTRTLAVVAATLLVATSASAATNEMVWQSPTTLSATMRDTVGPRIAASNDGQRLTAVWEYDADNFAVFAASSTDAGNTWSLRQPISPPDGYQPQVASSSDGTRLTAVWQRWDGSKTRIETASSADGGTTWESSQFLSDAGQSAYYPQVAVSADGTDVLAIWQRSDGSNDRVQARVSFDGGNSWSPAQTLSDSGGNAGAPRLHASADGSDLVVIWTRYDGSATRAQAATSSDSGTSWSTPATISDAGLDVSTPNIAGATDGSQLTATWLAFVSGAWGVQTSHSDDGGQSWSAPSTRATAGSSSRLSSSSNGLRVVATWIDGVGRVTVATSTDGGATWSSSRALSGTEAFDPEVAGSADGSRLIVVWRRSDGTVNRMQTASSGDVGSTWGTPQTISGPQGHASYPAVTLSDNGAKAVTGWRLSGDVPVIQVSAGRLPLPPSAPRSVMATASAGQALVSWQAPANNGGLPITWYGASVGAAKCGTSTTSCTVSGLTPGRTYVVKVTASNRIGTGPAATTSVTVPKTAQTAAVKLPKKVKPNGKTVLLRKAVTTNAGQKVKAKVTVTPKRAAKVKTTKAGRITVVTKGKKARVKLVLRAPATDTHSAFRLVKTWKVKRR